MTRKVKDLAVKVATYEKDGRTKGKYINIGAIMRGNDGSEFILMSKTFNPAGVSTPDGKDQVLISIFPIDHNAEYNSNNRSPIDIAHEPSKNNDQGYKKNYGNNDMDDEIPF